MAETEVQQQWQKMWTSSGRAATQKESKFWNKSVLEILPEWHSASSTNSSYGPQYSGKRKQRPLHHGICVFDCLKSVIGGWVMSPAVRCSKSNLLICLSLLLLLKHTPSHGPLTPLKSSWRAIITGLVFHLISLLQIVTRKETLTARAEDNEIQHK